MPKFSAATREDIDQQRMMIEASRKYPILTVYSSRKIKATHLCTELPLLCFIATVLEGLFREYHSSSTTLYYTMRLFTTS